MSFFHYCYNFVNDHDIFHVSTPILPCTPEEKTPPESILQVAARPLSLPSESFYL